MKPDNKHKQKASREYKKKHGLLQPILSKKQKEKEMVNKLESNWDRYDDTDADSDVWGLPLNDLLGRAKAPSAFQAPSADNSFRPKYKFPIRLQDYEAALTGLDLAKLLRLENVKDEAARLLNHQPDPEVENEDHLLFDPLYEAVQKLETKYSDDVADFIGVNFEPTKEAQMIMQPSIADTDDINSAGSSDLEDWLDSVI